MTINWYEAGEMVRHLTETDGFPITALSDTLDIPRGNLYRWMSGDAVPSAVALVRLTTVSNALAGEEPGSLSLFWKYGERPLMGEASLHEVMREQSSDVARIRAAMDSLRPLVTATLSVTDEDRRPHGNGELDDADPPTNFPNSYTEIGS